MKRQYGIDLIYDIVGQIFINGGRYTLAEQMNSPTSLVRWVFLLAVGCDRSPETALIV
ncbi:MAG: hypothetical protein V7K31_26905 [Nostoc sp.]